MDERAQDFDLSTFLPYLLNQAAEATSHSFQEIYRRDHGMTRAQWRVLANIGKFGSMTARDICRISHIEKTKVSRAVTALADAGLLSRSPGTDDRRTEILALTDAGTALFRDLGAKAIAYDRDLRARIGAEDSRVLDRLLRELVAMGTFGEDPD